MLQMTPCVAAVSAQRRHSVAVPWPVRRHAVATGALPGSHMDDLSRAGRSYGDKAEAAAGVAVLRRMDPAQAGWLGRGDHRQGAPGAAGRRAAACETLLFSCVLPSVRERATTTERSERPCDDERTKGQDRG